MAAKINIKPIGGNILVKPEEVSETTKSGLIVQTSTKGERPQKGKVVALGTGAIDESGKKIAFNVSVGDEVMFKKYSPEEVEIDGEEYLIMKESDILGVFN
ncbi:co-chaperone GroES [Candidatus Dojkabacteria bacterium]|uniref:Co-chaperonin GroES n=1 Tax=Candidatus Dojkabacteria bacterium TaxID=2099670 RepID=A0A955L1Z1_9BACT|nr:co-chaperone GroES [Candidatus Dojkabacteria bacterium]